MKIKMKISSLLLLSLLACNANNNNPSVVAPAPVIAKPSPAPVSQDDYDDYDATADIDYAADYLGTLLENQCLTVDTEGEYRSILYKRNYSYFQYLPDPEKTRFICSVIAYSADLHGLEMALKQPANISIEIKTRIKEKLKSSLQEKERMIKEQKEKSRRSKQKKMK